MGAKSRLGHALATLAGVAALAGGAPALAAGPGLPRTYDVIRVDSPNPMETGTFGWGIASADVTGDGKADLLVAQAQAGTGNGGEGQIFLFDGTNGRHIDTIEPPEQNPDAIPETLAFVYVETMPDVGSCPSGDGNDADKLCDDDTVGEGDGIPEIIAGSRNLRVNASDGSLDPVASDPNVGRAYVFDGRTRAVIKRIDMPEADRQAQAGANFGRLVMSLQGMEPCAGDSAENNAVGVAPCPDLSQLMGGTAEEREARARRARIGDVNGGGEPDIIVTARNWRASAATAPAGSPCQAGGNCTVGRAWVFAGEAIPGSPTDEILSDGPGHLIHTIADPEWQAASPEFGGNVFRVGDVNGDGAPEFAVAARNMDYPLDSPDSAWTRAGAAYLYNGATGALMRTYTSPDPQPHAQFSGSFNSGRPVGNVGATTIPDVLLGAPFHNRTSTDDGMAWVFNAITGGGGASGSWQFASMQDPTPMLGGNFGSSQTGVGDLVAETPANEVLIGGFGPFDPFTEASKNIVTDLHFMNPETQRVLQTVASPDGARGDAFGTGVTPMGDLNGDGFLDFAASAYLANLTYPAQGRAYIFKSNNTPVAKPAAPQPTPTGRELEPGSCANQLTGTNDADLLRGTQAGDNVHGRGGNDLVIGYSGADCVDAGPDDDVVRGGTGADRLLGAGGRDRLVGARGRDRLYGETGPDRLLGRRGKDLLAGGTGRDRLRGGPDRDRIFGENGRDRLFGGAGRNHLDGGGGADVIEARNGRRDVILCGNGDDVARVDPQDSVNGCERVIVGGER